MSKFTAVLIVTACVGLALCEPDSDVDALLKVDFVYNGKVVGKMQSHVTFAVDYPEKSGKNSTAHVPIRNPTAKVTNYDEKKGVLEAQITFEGDPKKETNDTATFVVKFVKNADGVVEWTAAKANIPVTNAFNFAFNALDYDSHYELDFVTGNRSVGNAKQSYQCTTVVTFGNEDDDEVDANMQMSKTQIALFANTFKGGLTCPEDAHTTTPAPPPTTTPTPAGPWTFRVEDEGGNKTCILMRTAITLLITWTDTNNKTISGKYPIAAHEFNTTDVTAGSSCNETAGNTTQQVLKIRFWKDWHLTMRFGLDGPDKFQLEHVDLQYDLNAAPHGMFPHPMHPSGKFKNDVKYISTPLDHSYQCISEPIQIKVEPDFTLSLAQLQVQAFAEKNDFEQPQLCPADLTSSDLVPIIVGACLAALVVIVLVAYLIGRARAQRRGYSSV